MPLRGFNKKSVITNNRPEFVVAFLNQKLEEITGRPAKQGMLFGVELELEGRNVALEGVPSKNWTRKAEGSLRGENMEYVFQKPCEYEEALKRVDALFKTFKKNGVVLNNSHRTSTHVHLNFSDKTVKQIVLFFFLHTVLEELLASYCGDSRLGNLFCINTRDNEELVDMLDAAIFKHRSFMDFGEGIRYCAANLAALNQFGSIEIRTMRGANTYAEVAEWMEILNSLYTYCCQKEPPEPWKIIENLSHLGAEGFLLEIFPRHLVDALIKAWSPVKDLQRSLYEGVRLVQMLAYKLEEAWQVKPPELPKKKAPDHLVKLPQGANGVDRVRLPNGETWYVNLVETMEDGERMEVGHVTFIFDKYSSAWYDRDTGRYLEWLIYNGNRIVPGTDAWDLVNAPYLDTEDEEEDD